MVFVQEIEKSKIWIALVAAKSLDALEVVPVLQTRGRLMQKCCEGKEGIF